MPDLNGNDGGTSLIDNLRLPRCYPHPASNIRMLETHISWVFLTGEYAYKIKKPLNLGFLDFSTLEKRRRCCAEEIRLNRRLAPQIYLDVVSITGSTASPHIAGDGPAIEYAVRMRQFPQDALASTLQAGGRLLPQHLETLAATLAAFHQAAPAADASSGFGTPQSILDAALQNFDQLSPLLTAAEDAADLEKLRLWTMREHTALIHLMAQRRIGGAVRECHGDLHLGNIVLIGNSLVPFDCIEFNPALRWNDVFSEIAFLIMDLHDRGSPRLAWLFLNAYFVESRDIEGMTLLPFYLVYRAMVRAKVHALRAGQSGIAVDEQTRLMNECLRYLTLAQQFSRPPAPALIITHGLSGSGKSRVAAEVMQHSGAVRIRSDIERKRLYARSSSADTASAVAVGVYSAEATRRLYHHLADVARRIIKAGQNVIVDATFLQRWQRDLLRKVARETAVPFLIVNVTAPKDVLCARIRQRRSVGDDPSEADLAVLEHQLATQEPLAANEMAATVTLPSEQLTSLACCEQVIKALTAAHPPNSS